MNEAEKLLIDSLESLKKDYATGIRFFTERDIVWNVQKEIIRLIGKELNFKVFNNYPRTNTGKSKKRQLCADLAILKKDANNGKSEVLIEFKYEPAHKRAENDDDFRIGKFKNPVVFLHGESSVAEDQKRIKSWVGTGEARIGYSIFIDEGSYFYPNKKRIKLLEGDWQTNDDGWGKDMAVLIMSFPKVK